MYTILLWIKSLWSWSTCFQSNAFSYQENTVSKKRRMVERPLPAGFMRAPPDHLWVEGFPRGETYRRMGKPPQSER